MALFRGRFKAILVDGVGRLRHIDPLSWPRSLPSCRSPLWSPELAVWRDAGEETACALAAWRDAPGDRMAYAAYRASQDREDAAQDALAYSHTSRISVS